MLFEVFVGAEDVMDVRGDDEAVVVVIGVVDKEDGELDAVMALDEATLEAGEAFAFGDMIAGLTLRGVRSSSRGLLGFSVVGPPPLVTSPIGLQEVVTSLIWSLVELSGGEFMVGIPLEAAEAIGPALS